MDFTCRRPSFMDDSVFRSSPSSLRAFGIDARDLYSPRSFPAYDRDAGFAADYFSLPFESSYWTYSPYYDDRWDRYHSHSELIRRSNCESAMANSSIMRLSRHALIHPMLCIDGGFPTDFNTPRPIEDFFEMGDGQLERILAAYELLRARRDDTFHEHLMSARFGLGYSQPRRLSRLVMLFESLGAYRLAGQLRWRRPIGLPRYGIPLTEYR